MYELAFHLADGIDAVQLSTLLPCTAMCGVSESPLQGLSRPMRVQVSLTRSAGCNDPSLLEIESLFSRIQCISIVPLSIPWSHANEPNELQALKRPPRRNESPEGSAHHTISPLSQAVGKEQLRTRNRLDAMEKWRLHERMFDMFARQKRPLHSFQCIP